MNGRTVLRREIGGFGPLAAGGVESQLRTNPGLDTVAYPDQRPGGHPLESQHRLV